MIPPPGPPDNPPTEAHVRQLRDVCFLRPITDAEWEKTKANWTRPENIKWLRAHQNNLSDSSKK
jgi:hypothetical protein